MTTPVVPQPPTPASATSPSSGAPSGAPAAPPTSTEPYRVPQTDSRPWARGKTLEEVLGITDQLATNLQTYVQQGSPVAPSAPLSPVTSFADGEYVSGAELNRQAPRLIDDRIQPHIAQMNETMASFALDRIRSEHAQEFEKYGPEIYGYLSRLDKKAGAWTVDNLKQVVKMVRADHVDEIVRDTLHAQSPMEPALRSTGAAPVSVTPSNVDLTLNSEKLPAEYREKLRAAGVTESTFDDFLKGSGQNRESFFKLFDRKMVITEAPRI